MITITAKITQPVENIEDFADSQGYFESVIDPNDDTKTIPNPESRVDYVKRLFLERSVGWFSAAAEKAIREAKTTEMNTLIDTKRDEIKSTITIN